MWEVNVGIVLIVSYVAHYIVDDRNGVQQTVRPTSVCLCVSVYVV